LGRRGLGESPPREQLCSRGRDGAATLLMLLLVNGSSHFSILNRLVELLL
jgi:hypothetical protein